MNIIILLSVSCHRNFQLFYNPTQSQTLSCLHHGVENWIIGVGCHEYESLLSANTLINVGMQTNRRHMQFAFGWIQDHYCYCSWIMTPWCFFQIIVIEKKRKVQCTSALVWNLLVLNFIGMDSGALSPSESYWMEIKSEHRRKISRFLWPAGLLFSKGYKAHRCFYS